MKHLSVIMILFQLLAGCINYEYMLSDGEIEHVYPAYFTGWNVANELTWTLWEMESIEGNLQGFPEYSGFYLFYRDEICTNIYKEINKQYFYIVKRECTILKRNDVNYLYGGGYFVGTTTFEVEDDRMTLQIDRGKGRLAWFLFKKINSVSVDVVFTESIQD